MKSSALLACLLAVVAPTITQAASANKDADFVKKAIQGDNSEIMLGSVAQQHGASEGVRAFGSMLVTDHTEGRDEATAVARHLNITPPTAAMAGADVERAKLALLSGRSFDREFARYMVKDHQQDIADFRAEAAHGRGEPAALAKKTLPVLRKHLATAQHLARAR